jgi:hypothetical protein
MGVCRRALALALLIFASALAGCRPPPEPESYVPADAALVVGIPQIEQALAAYQELEKRFAAVPTLKTDREKLMQELRELGFPFDQASLQNQGINTKQGLYFFMPTSGDRGCVLAGVKNNVGVDGLVMNVVKKISGASITFHPVTARGVRVTEARKADGQPAGVSWVHQKKTLVLCALSEELRGSVSDYTASIALRDPAQGMTKSADMKAVATALGPTQAWIFLNAEGVGKWILDKEKKKANRFAPRKKAKHEAADGEDDGDSDSDEPSDDEPAGRSPGPFELASYMDELKGYKSLSFGLALSGQEVTLRAFIHSTPERAAQDKRYATGQGPAPRFTSFLAPGGAAFVLRVSANMPAVVQNLKKRAAQIIGDKQLEDGAAQARSKLGLDIEKDVLGLFSGRFLLAMDPPSPELLRHGMERGPRGVAPELPIYLLAQVTDPKRAGGLLDSVRKTLTDLQVPVSASAGPEPIFSLLDDKPPTGEPAPALLRFGLVGDILLVSGGTYFTQVHERSRTAGKIGLGSPQVTAAMQSTDESLLFVDLTHVTSLIRAAMLLKPDPGISDMMPVLDQLRDLALVSKWRNDGTQAELQLRLR